MELIKSLQDDRGCFSCGKPNPTSICSRCKVVKYCDKECQKVHWKKVHNENCSVWCENYGGGPTDDKAVSIPVNMFSVGWIDRDEILVGEMRLRQREFFKEAFRCTNGRTRISFQIACIDICCRVRLVAAASVVVSGGGVPFTINVDQINHVLFETIDEGREALQRLYPSNGGSGTLSKAAKRFVIARLSIFVKRLNEHGLQASSMTYGRGLMWLSDDEESTEKIEENNAGAKMMWVPSMNYVIT